MDNTEVEVLLARLDERDKNHTAQYTDIKAQLTDINSNLVKQGGRISATESSLKFNQKVSWGSFLTAIGLTAFFNYLKP